jgi:hypothetical protein
MIIAQQFIAGFQIGQRIDSPVGTAEDAASDVPSSMVLQTQWYNELT